MFCVFALVAMTGVAVLLQLTEFPATLAIGSSEEVDRTAVGHCSSSESDESESDGEIEEDLAEEDEAPDLPDDTSAASVPGVTIQRFHGLGGPQSRMTTLLIYSLLAPMSFYTGFEVGQSQVSLMAWTGLLVGKSASFFPTPRGSVSTHQHSVHSAAVLATVPDSSGGRLPPCPCHALTSRHLCRARSGQHSLQN